ncbi:MAG: PorT family protein [Lentimicrobiaceae bacterium]|nr:PorT family protein [Lentimicrobiaceae bacterium]
MKQMYLTPVNKDKDCCKRATSHLININLLRKQRNYVLFILIFLMVSIHAGAQKTNYNLGFRIAPNLGWLKPDAEDFVSKGSHLGFSWGFVSEFELTENYLLVTGFNVLQNRGELKYREQMAIPPDSILLEGWNHRKYSLKYLQIPLTLKLRTNELGYFRYYGQIGLGTGFLISAKTDEDFYSGTQTKGSENKNIYDDISKIRLSLLLEAGVEYKIEGFSTLVFGIRFDNGFTNVLSFDNYYLNDVDPFAIGNTVELTLGILINP